MHSTLTLVFFLFMFQSSFAQSNGQTKLEEDQVKLVIDALFDGMRIGDSSQVHSTFHPKARLMTCYFDKNGNSILAEDDLKEFITAVGTPHEDIWNEKITSITICVDANLAQVWTEYTFYLNDEKLHCGVNAFQLFKENSIWKIIQLTDTRRREGCN